MANVFSDERGVGNIPVTNDLLKAWEIDADRLHQDAINAVDMDDYRLYRIEDVIGELMGIAMKSENLLDKEEYDIAYDEYKMYVLTNNKKIDGAAAIIDANLMKEVGKRLGSCYIIPSSIHECILIPDDGIVRAKELEEMISEVNMQEVAPNEILSYKAQYYDADFNILESAREHENPVGRATGKRLHRQNPNKGIDR